jgi:hypothetical protein
MPIRLQILRRQMKKKDTHLQYLCEDIILHCGVVYTDRAAANLHAVQHEVVVLPANLHMGMPDMNMIR